MKSLLFAAFFSMVCAFAFSGCKTQPNDCNNCKPTLNLFGSFGDEHYIWENFIFSTNTVDHVE